MICRDLWSLSLCKEFFSDSDGQVLVVPLYCGAREVSKDERTDAVQLASKLHAEKISWPYTMKNYDKNKKIENFLS
eukprot:UN10853